VVGISVKSPQSPLMARPCCTIITLGKSYENINLNDTEWAPAPGNGKWYLPLSSTPSNNVTKLSAAHKVKGFADDISVFSSSASDYAVALRTIDNHCSVLDLTLKPAKCISLVFNKTWLGLPRGTTTAILHHPNVIDIPTLSELRTQAKPTFFSSVSTSNDPVIKEISSLMLDREFSKDLKIWSYMVSFLKPIICWSLVYHLYRLSPRSL